MAHKIYRRYGSVDWAGVAWLSFWSIILGPFFTALVIIYLMIERWE